MKEFSAQTGGRYTYVDDILNLQELSLAFAEIFSGCDSFVVSGCRVSGNSISDGYVFLNGKIRYFSGASDVKKFPYYIYEVNKYETVPYANGDTKVGRYVYSCVGSTKVPSAKDPITKLAPASIEISERGALTIKDAFFGKYALLLNPEKKQQTVHGNVNLIGSATISEKINVKDIVVGEQSHKIHSYIDSDSLCTESIILGSRYKIKYTKDNLTLSIDGRETLTADSDKCDFICVVAKRANIGAIVLDNNNILRQTPGSIDINVKNKNGCKTSTRIGNGNGKVLLDINGEHDRIAINGTAVIDTAEINLSSAKKNRIFKDENISIGSFGKNNDGCIEFTSQKPIIISSLEYVDISNIKENGVLLSTKYLTANTFRETVKTLASKSNVYDKEYVDKHIATKSGGLSQFIVRPTIVTKDGMVDRVIQTPIVTEATLRRQIGAIGEGELNDYAKLSNHLSDMAKDEEGKKEIRKNIGAVGFNECQRKLKDTGWIILFNDVYIRQIGNIVCIQGTHRYLSKGFHEYTIPAEIDQPTHGVSCRFSDIETHGWIRIAGNQRTIVICGTSKRYHPIEICLTYMV